MKPRWQKHLVIMLMKDGSHRGLRVEVDTNNPSSTRVYDEILDRDNAVSVIGSIPGWPPVPLPDRAPKEVTLTKEQVEQAREVASMRFLAEVDEEGNA